jgi:hypothetical protein
VSWIHMIIGVIIGACGGGEVSFVAPEDLLSAGMRFYDDIHNEISVYVRKMFL